MCMTKSPMTGTDALGALAASYLSKRTLTNDESVSTGKADKGSARRKLWDLATGAHCPVSGVCLRLEDVRRLAARAGLLDAPGTEYDLHVLLVAECRSRTPLAEQVQRALDKRYDLCIRRSQKLKTAEALANWWDESIIRADWAGVFWAVLTHPKCSIELEYLVLGQVHMLQHQTGMAARVDHTRFDELTKENQRMGKALEAGQRRIAALAQDQARMAEQHQAEVMRLREELIRAQTGQSEAMALVASLRQETPGLETRQRLALDKLRLLEHNRKLKRALLQAEGALKHAAPPQEARHPPPQAPANTAISAAQALSVHDRSVLCVGGRQRVVPIYREVVEERGARFSHHDGGSEDKVGQLGHLLQAADLVVCQVGCVSHDAYWRVKEHCKRHNKPCLFVETPSRSAIERAFEGLSPPATSLTT